MNFQDTVKTALAGPPVGTLSLLPEGHYQAKIVSASLTDKQKIKIKWEIISKDDAPHTRDYQGRFVWSLLSLSLDENQRVHNQIFFAQIKSMGVTQKFIEELSDLDLNSSLAVIAGVLIGKTASLRIKIDVDWSLNIVDRINSPIQKEKEEWVDRVEDFLHLIPAPVVNKKPAQDRTEVSDSTMKISHREDCKVNTWELGTPQILDGMIQISLYCVYGCRGMLDIDTNGLSTYFTAFDHSEHDVWLKENSPDKTDLYEHYDEKGILLYSGISFNSWNRSYNGHAKNADWWREVFDTRTKHLNTRKEAEAAEIQSIHLKHPVHNIKHSICNCGDGSNCSVRCSCC